MKQRSMAASTVVKVCLGAPLIITSFYVPIYFQVSLSSLQTGNHPSSLPDTFYAGNQRHYCQRGRQEAVTVLPLYCRLRHSNWHPFPIVGCAILVVGCSLLSTLNVSSGKGMWHGYQVRRFFTTPH